MRVVGADEAMRGHLLDRAGQPVPLGIGAAGIKPDLLRIEGLHHVVGLFRRGAGADRHMRLAIFQVEQAGAGQIAHDQPGMPLLKLGQHRHHQRGQRFQRGDDQLARDVVALPLEPAGQLAELVLGRLRHAQQVLPRLGGRVTARVALEQLDPQPPLERVDMADDGGMMHAHHLGRAAHRADPRHLVGGAHLVPIVHGAPLACAQTHNWANAWRKLFARASPSAPDRAGLDSGAHRT